MKDSIKISQYFSDYRKIESKIKENHFSSSTSIEFTARAQFKLSSISSLSQGKRFKKEIFKIHYQGKTIATSLEQKKAGKILYFLDEPSTGLHLKDVQVLIQVLKKLISTHHSVIAIEHQLELITQCN